MTEAPLIKMGSLAVSVVLMASPWWLEPVQNVSAIAALFAPIVGVAVGVLTGIKIVRDLRKKP